MSGWIHVITGPMFSGKTEALLRLVRRYDIMGKSLVLFRPEVDTRTSEVTSRVGLSFPAIPIKHPQEILHEIEAYHVDIVAVDEAQFLDKELAEIAEALADSGVLVIISGLDRDFLQHPFGPMERLLTYADEVDKLSAICFVCKGEATLTQRLVNGRPATPNDPLILVGGIGDDTYEARCRLHHEIGVV